MSLTTNGLFLMVVGYLATKLNIDKNNLVITITTIAQIVGLAMAYWGRYRQGDITWYGARKSR